MNLLVVGASGFIGGHLMETARGQGHRAAGTCSRAGVSGLTKFDLLDDRILDCIPPSLLAGREPAAVIVAAVVGNMDLCLTDPEKTRRINVLHTIRLMRDCYSAGAKIAFLSTGHVFDGSRGNYREDDPTHPVNTYARHKLEVEQFLLKEIPGAFIARLDKVVGDNPGQHHLFSEWYGLLREGRPLVCAEGMEISPTGVRDVAAGILLACERDLAGIYHLAGPEPARRDDLARRFCCKAGFPEHVTTQPLAGFGFRDGRALKSSLCADKFCRASGMRFAGIDALIDAFCAQVKS